MGLNKSPGSDSITVEFYKAFWDILKMHYVKSVNFSFQNQSLTELQKQGLITLIKLMKGKALRKHSLHEKTAASVLLKLFISGNE